MTTANLTRRQREILRRLQSGTKIRAGYQGGPAEDMENWDFWTNDDAVGCAPTARALIAAGLASIGEPDRFGYYLVLASKEPK